MNNTINFLGIMAPLGGRTVVTAKLSLRQLKETFKLLPEDVPIEVKEQREVNKSRSKKIFDYIQQNNDFIFNGVIAIVDSLDVSRLDVANSFDNSGVQIVSISLTESINRFLVDGQHRLSGISLEGLRDDVLDGNFMDVMFIKSEGIDANRRIFVDLNKNSKVTSGAINISFDTRETVSVFTKRTLDALPEVKRVIDYQMTSASGDSRYLWTINQFAKFLEFFTGFTPKVMNEVLNDEERMDGLISIVRQYFEALFKNQFFFEATSEKLKASDVRKSSVLATAIMLETLGVVGNEINKNRIAKKIDWDGIDFSKINLILETDSDSIQGSSSLEYITAFRDGIGCLRSRNKKQ